MIVAGICRSMIFSTMVIADRVSLAERTIKPRPVRGETQSFAHEADDFLAQRIAGARPRFDASKLFHTRLERTKLNIIGTGSDQAADSLFQKIKKREFIPCAGMVRDVQQRYGNGRRRGRKMRHNLLITDCSQDVTHSLRELIECDHVFVVSQMQIKSNAFGHVIGEPPPEITGFMSSPGDRRVKPIAIEFEKLSRLRAEIRKFFFKRDHGACSLKFCVVLPWNLAASQRETIPAAEYWVLCDAPTCEWHRQIHQHPEIADTPRRNANRPLRRWRGVFRALWRQSPKKELRARWFPARAQSRPPYLPR